MGGFDRLSATLQEIAARKSADKAEALQWIDGAGNAMIARGLRQAARLGFIKRAPQLAGKVKAGDVVDMNNGRFRVALGKTGMPFLLPVNSGIVPQAFADLVDSGEVPDANLSNENPPDKQKLVCELTHAADLSLSEPEKVAVANALADDITGVTNVVDVQAANAATANPFPFLAILIGALS